jgi:hypothetical protein
MSGLTGDKGFLSRDNLHRAVWALVGAAVTGLSGLLYRGIKGPDEVKVVAKEDSPLLVKVSNPTSASPSAGDVAALVRAIDRLAQAGNRSTPAKQQQALIESVISASAKVQPPVAKSGAPAEHTTTGSGIAAGLAVSPHVSQYMEARLREKGVSETKCPEPSSAGGTPLTLAFSVPENWRIADATDATFSVARINSSTSLTEIFDAAQTIKPGLNSVTFDRTLSPGAYRLEYGFFIKSELSKETPKLYAIVCNLVVTSPA